MVTRLPDPGSDNGTWGNILNDFLEVSHNADGTLQTNAVQETGAAQLSGATFTGYVAPAHITETFGVTIVVNASLGNDFFVTLTNSLGTLANPSSPAACQIIRFHITQGTGGNFTVAYGNAYDFGVAGQPVLSTSAGKVDILAFQYDPNLTKWCYIGAGLGF